MAAAHSNAPHASGPPPGAAPGDDPRVVVGADYAAFGGGGSLVDPAPSAPPALYEHEFDPRPPQTSAPQAQAQTHAAYYSYPASYPAHAGDYASPWAGAGGMAGHAPAAPPGIGPRYQSGSAAWYSDGQGDLPRRDSGADAPFLPPTSSAIATPLVPAASLPVASASASAVPFGSPAAAAPGAAAAGSFRDASGTDSGYAATGTAANTLAAAVRTASGSKQQAKDAENDETIAPALALQPPKGIATPATCRLCATRFSVLLARAYQCVCCGGHVCHACSASCHANLALFAPPSASTLPKKGERICSACGDHWRAGSPLCARRMLAVLAAEGAPVDTSECGLPPNVVTSLLGLADAAESAAASASHFHGVAAGLVADGCTDVVNCVNSGTYTKRSESHGVSRTVTVTLPPATLASLRRAGARAIDFMRAVDEHGGVTILARLAATVFRMVAPPLGLEYELESEASASGGAAGRVAGAAAASSSGGGGGAGGSRSRFVSSVADGPPLWREAMMAAAACQRLVVDERLFPCPEAMFATAKHTAASANIQTTVLSVSAAAGGATTERRASGTVDVAAARKGSINSHPTAADAAGGSLPGWYAASATRGRRSSSGGNGIDLLPGSGAIAGASSGAEVRDTDVHAAGASKASGAGGASSGTAATGSGSRRASIDSASGKELTAKQQAALQLVSAAEAALAAPDGVARLRTLRSQVDIHPAGMGCAACQQAAKASESASASEGYTGSADIPSKHTAGAGGAAGGAGSARPAGGAVAGGTAALGAGSARNSALSGTRMPGAAAASAPVPPVGAAGQNTADIMMDLPRMHVPAASFAALCRSPHATVVAAHIAAARMLVALLQLSAASAPLVREASPAQRRWALPGFMASLVEGNETGAALLKMLQRHCADGVVQEATLQWHMARATLSSAVDAVMSGSGGASARAVPTAVGAAEYAADAHASVACSWLVHLHVARVATALLIAGDEWSRLHASMGGGTFSSLESTTIGGASAVAGAGTAASGGGVVPAAGSGESTAAEDAEEKLVSLRTRLQHQMLRAGALTLWPAWLVEGLAYVNASAQYAGDLSELQRAAEGELSKPTPHSSGVAGGSKGCPSCYAAGIATSAFGLRVQGGCEGATAAVHPDSDEDEDELSSKTMPTASLASRGSSSVRLEGSILHAMSHIALLLLNIVQPQACLAAVHDASSLRSVLTRSARAYDGVLLGRIKEDLMALTGHAQQQLGSVGRSAADATHQGHGDAMMTVKALGEAVIAAAGSLEHALRATSASGPLSDAAIRSAAGFLLQSVQAIASLTDCMQAAAVSTQSSGSSAGFTTQQLFGLQAAVLHYALLPPGEQDSKGDDEGDDDSADDGDAASAKIEAAAAAAAEAAAASASAAAPPQKPAAQHGPPTASADALSVVLAVLADPSCQAACADVIDQKESEGLFKAVLTVLRLALSLPQDAAHSGAAKNLAGSSSAPTAGGKPYARLLPASTSPARAAPAVPHPAATVRAAIRWSGWPWLLRLFNSLAKGLSTTKAGAADSSAASKGLGVASSPPLLLATMDAISSALGAATAMETASIKQHGGSRRSDGPSAPAALALTIVDAGFLPTAQELLNRGIALPADPRRARTHRLDLSDETSAPHQLLATTGRLLQSVMSCLQWDGMLGDDRDGSHAAEDAEALTKLPAAARPAGSRPSGTASAFYGPATALAVHLAQIASSSTALGGSSAGSRSFKGSALTDVLRAGRACMAVAVEYALACSDLQAEAKASARAASTPSAAAGKSAASATAGTAATAAAWNASARVLAVAASAYELYAGALQLLRLAAQGDVVFGGGSAAVGGAGGARQRAQQHDSAAAAHVAGLAAAELAAFAADSDCMAFAAEWWSRQGELRKLLACNEPVHTSTCILGRRLADTRGHGSSSRDALSKSSTGSDGACACVTVRMAADITAFTAAASACIAEVSGAAGGGASLHQVIRLITAYDTSTLVEQLLAVCLDNGDSEQAATAHACLAQLISGAAAVSTSSDRSRYGSSRGLDGFSSGAAASGEAVLKALLHRTEDLIASAALAVERKGATALTLIEAVLRTAVVVLDEECSAEPAPSATSTSSAVGSWTAAASQQRQHAGFAATGSVAVGGIRPGIAGPGRGSTRRVNSAATVLGASLLLRACSGLLRVAGSHGGHGKLLRLMQSDAIVQLLVHASSRIGQHGSREAAVAEAAPVVDCLIRSLTLVSLGTVDHHLDRTPTSVTVAAALAVAPPLAALAAVGDWPTIVQLADPFSYATAMAAGRMEAEWRGPLPAEAWPGRGSEADRAGTAEFRRGSTAALLAPSARGLAAGPLQVACSATLAAATQAMQLLREGPLHERQDNAAQELMHAQPQPSHLHALLAMAARNLTCTATVCWTVDGGCSTGESIAGPAGESCKAAARAHVQAAARFLVEAATADATRSLWLSWLTWCGRNRLQLLLPLIYAARMRSDENSSASSVPLRVIRDVMTAQQQEQQREDAAPTAVSANIAALGPHHLVRTAATFPAGPLSHAPMGTQLRSQVDAPMQPAASLTALDCWRHIAASSVDAPSVSTEAGGASASGPSTTGGREVSASQAESSGGLAAGLLGMLVQSLSGLSDTSSGAGAASDWQAAEKLASDLGLPDAQPLLLRFLAQPGTCTPLLALGANLLRLAAANCPAARCTVSSHATYLLSLPRQLSRIILPGASSAQPRRHGSSAAASEAIRGLPLPLTTRPAMTASARPPLSVAQLMGALSQSTPRGATPAVCYELHCFAAQIPADLFPPQLRLPRGTAAPPIAAAATVHWTADMSRALRQQFGHLLLQHGEPEGERARADDAACTADCGDRLAPTTLLAALHLCRSTDAEAATIGCAALLSALEADLPRAAAAIASSAVQPAAGSAATASAAAVPGDDMQTVLVAVESIADIFCKQQHLLFVQRYLAAAVLQLLAANSSADAAVSAEIAEPAHAIATSTIAAAAMLQQCMLAAGLSGLTQLPEMIIAAAGTGGFTSASHLTRHAHATSIAASVSVASPLRVAPVVVIALVSAAGSAAAALESNRASSSHADEASTCLACNADYAVALLSQLERAAAVDSGAAQAAARFSLRLLRLAVTELEKTAAGSDIGNATVATTVGPMRAAGSTASSAAAWRLPISHAHHQGEASDHHDYVHVWAHIALHAAAAAIRASSNPLVSEHITEISPRAAVNPSHIEPVAAAASGFAGAADDVAQSELLLVSLSPVSNPVAAVGALEAAGAPANPSSVTPERRLLPLLSTDGLLSVQLATPEHMPPTPVPAGEPRRSAEASRGAGAARYIRSVTVSLPVLEEVQGQDLAADAVPVGLHVNAMPAVGAAAALLLMSEPDTPAAGLGFNDAPAGSSMAPLVAAVDYHGDEDHNTEPRSGLVAFAATAPLLGAAHQQHAAIVAPPSPTLPVLAPCTPVGAAAPARCSMEQSIGFSPARHCGKVAALSAGSGAFNFELGAAAAADEAPLPLTLAHLGGAFTAAVAPASSAAPIATAGGSSKVEQPALEAITHLEPLYAEMQRLPALLARLLLASLRCITQCDEDRAKVRTGVREDDEAAALEYSKRHIAYFTPAAAMSQAAQPASARTTAVAVSSAATAAGEGASWSLHDRLRAALGGGGSGASSARVPHPLAAPGYGSYQRGSKPAPPPSAAADAAESNSATTTLLAIAAQCGAFFFARCRGSSSTSSSELAFVQTFCTCSERTCTMAALVDALQVAQQAVGALSRKAGFEAGAATTAWVCVLMCSAMGSACAAISRGLTSEAGAPAHAGRAAHTDHAVDVLRSLCTGALPTQASQESSLETDLANVLQIAAAAALAQCC